MELSDATEKSPVIPGIDPGTFRRVAQCLNHYVTPAPKDRNNLKFYVDKAKHSKIEVVAPKEEEDSGRIQPVVFCDVTFFDVITSLVSIEYGVYGCES
jgi:hypothetical protein